MLATDPGYLEGAGVDFGTLKAAIILDGKGLDLTADRMRMTDFTRKQVAKLADDDAGIARLSPLTHATAPNAPHFLFQVIKNDERSAANASALASALRKAGSSAEVRLVSGTQDSRETNLGDPSNKENDFLLRVLNEATGR